MSLLVDVGTAFCVATTDVSTVPGPAPYEEFYGPVGAQKWKDKTLGGAWRAHGMCMTVLPWGNLDPLGSLPCKNRRL